MNIITYKLGNNLYLNLTNRCPNNCDFCLRNMELSVMDSGWHDGKRSNLWLDSEPTVAEVIADLEKHDLSDYGEIVFCGYGEPLTRLNDCVQIAKYLKQKGAYVRVNTNGLADLIHHIDSSQLLKGAVDCVSISLNAKDKATYHQICQSTYGEPAFDALLAFGKHCASVGIKVVYTVVDTCKDIDECRILAEQNGGILQVRKII